MIVFVVVCGNCSVEVLHYFLPEFAEVDSRFEQKSDWELLAEIDFQRWIAADSGLSD